MSKYPADANSPNWDSASKVHDWMNYINDELREAWPSFTEEQQRIIAANAQEIADQEQWD